MRLSTLIDQQLCILGTPAAAMGPLEQAMVTPLAVWAVHHCRADVPKHMLTFFIGCVTQSCHGQLPQASCLLHASCACNISSVCGPRMARSQTNHNTLGRFWVHKVKRQRECCK